MHSKTRLVFSLLGLAAMTLAAQPSSTCPAITWTIDTNYTDSSTNLAMLPAITGDGVQTDVAGNSVYVNNNGSVLVRLNCGKNPSYDATLEVSRTRSFQVSLANALGNDYQKFPPSATLNGGLLNVSDILWCQNHGFANGCTFYTRLTTALTGSDRNTYHLRMENPNSVPVTSWQPDATANCPYVTSPVQVVFTPGSQNSDGKDTYVVTPALQGTNTGTGWTAPQQNSGCPANSSLPAGSWPAGVAALILDGTGNSYNYGQYNVPFRFVIRNQ